MAGNGAGRRLRKSCWRLVGDVAAALSVVAWTHSGENIGGAWRRIMAAAARRKRRWTNVANDLRVAVLLLHLLIWQRALGRRRLPRCAAFAALDGGAAIGNSDGGDIARRRYNHQRRRRCAKANGSDNMAPCRGATTRRAACQRLYVLASGRIVALGVRITCRASRGENNLFHQAASGAKGGMA